MSSKFKKPVIKRSNNGAINDISKAMNKTGFVEVGVISAAQHKESDLTVASIAFANEFGVGVPERSFMRSTMKEEKSAIANLSKGLMAEIVKGKTTPLNGLGKIGAFSADKIRLKINDIQTPSNAPETVRLKGSSNPLIATRQMLNSITYEVKSGSVK